MLSGVDNLHGLHGEQRRIYAGPGDHGHLGRATAARERACILNDLHSRDAQARVIFNGGRRALPMMPITG
jgi:hypothetical protein